MDHALRPNFLTVEEYLAGEEGSDARHEFLEGMVYAMAVSSDAHNIIALNLASAFRNHLRGGPCRVFMAEVKARLLVAEREVFYYPDVMITCDSRDSDRFFKQYLRVIAEVLSESTEGIDRLEKFWNYTQIESLEEYLLVAQERPEVTVFRRNQQWKPEIINRVEDHVMIGSLTLKLPL